MLVAQTWLGKKAITLGGVQNERLKASFEKISSGHQINRAADDAAGLAVSSKMRMQVTEMIECESNVGQGLDLARAADGALEEVSAMLLRADELCLQAANGTYDQEVDRVALRSELDQICVELERVLSGTEFQDIRVFRHTGDRISEAIYNYKETVTTLPVGTLEKWGEMDFIKEQEFDLSVPAQGASVTMVLEEGIDLNDASTLAGKSLYVSGYGSYTFGASQTGTVQDALDRMSNAMANVLDKANTKVTQVGGKNAITFTYKPVDLMQTILVDGKPTPYPVPGASGVGTNGRAIYSTQSGFLTQVDGSNAANNVFTYGDTITTRRFTFLSGFASDQALTQEHVDNLVQNTIYIGNTPLQFTATSAANKINLTVGMTAGAVRAALTNAINTLPAFDNVSASMDAAGTVALTYSNISTTSAAGYTVRETTALGTNQYYQPQASVPGSGISSSRTITPTVEKPDGYEVQLPADTTLPFSFQVTIGGYRRNYTYYDSSIIPVGYPNITGSGTLMDMKGKTQEEIYAQMVRHISSDASSSAFVTRTGNTVSIIGKTPNQSLGFSTNGFPSNLDFYKYVPGSSALALQGASHSFVQDYSIPMNLQAGMGGAGQPFDAEKLYGRGFSFQNATYEFGKAGQPQAYPGANLIDVSTATSFEEIRAAMAAKLGANYTLTVDGAGQLRIAGVRNTGYGSPSFSDGMVGTDGLFNNPGNYATVSGVSAGGVNASQPQTIIDFSSFDGANLNDLLGKGFRVNCATCAGEFINVIFCYDKENAKFPESFEYEDKSQNPPVTRTIKNYVVDLKNTPDSSSIVQNLVDQLKPDLDHYTDVEVGTPATTLILKDKRAGNVIVNGTHYRAKVSSGVYTNATYDVDITEVIAMKGGGVNVEALYRGVFIYAGSHPEPQYIPVHLPYLDSATLGINPPEPDLSTPEGAMETRERVQAAAATISACRGQIGADQNRLEWAYQAISSSELQITTAMSRITDTDVAKQVTDHTKLSILKQATEGALMHINQQPQHVLALIRG